MERVKRRIETKSTKLPGSPLLRPVQGKPPHPEVTSRGLSRQEAPLLPLRSAARSQESPGDPPPSAPEITNDGTAAKQPKKKGKKPVTRNPLVTKDWLPSRIWQIRDSQVTYQPFQDVVFECDATLKPERAWSRTLLFPIKPVCLVDSLTNPAKLPVPLGKEDIHKDLVKYPGMMMLPKPRYDGCHAGRCSCVVHGQKDVRHRTSELPDVCLRDGSLAERDLAVVPKFKNFVENPSHYYF
jgi:hypothetical protein